MIRQHSGRSKSRMLARALWTIVLGSLCATVSHGQTWDPIVDVGPGIPDTNTRQVVRTSANVVYICVLSATLNTNSTSVIHMYKGAPAGNPNSFSEVDAAHAPTNITRFGGVDIRLDSSNKIQVLYEDQSALQERYVLFDTATDTWGTSELVDTLPGAQNNRYQSRTAICIDKNGAPHVFYGASDTTSR